MSLTWTPVESGTPTWTPAEDDDLTFTTRGTLSSDAVTYDGDTLTAFLDDLDTSGGGADHTVAVFADDFDPTGSFTTVPLLDVGAIPRAYLTGATVLIIEGDHLGIWTVPASGPGTPGPALAPGDVIASQSGRTATAYTVDGTTVAGVNVTAIADGGASIERALQATQVLDTPTRWLECGEDGRGHWYCTTKLDLTGATNLRLRGWFRSISGDPDTFQEGQSEGLDSGGVPGEGGTLDLYEHAKWLRPTGVRSYGEQTTAGGTTESHLPDDPEGPTGPTIPGWTHEEVEFDLVAGTITLRYESLIAPDHVDDNDGTTWRTTKVYRNPAMTSFEVSNAPEQWLGRGGGRFDLGPQKAWVDGVLAQQPDIDGATDGDTEVADLVLESAPGVPAVWHARSSAVVGSAPTGGGGGGLDETAVQALIDSAVAAVVGGAPGALDALNELAAALGDDASFAATVTTALAGKVGTGDSRLTDTRTPTDGSVTVAKLTSAVLDKIGRTVETTIDSAARTSNTYTADGTLQFEGAADTTYRIDAYLIFQGDATADLKVGFSTPAGTMHLTVEGALTTVASASDYDRFLTLTSSGATTVVGVAGSSTPISVRISGVIHLTSAGTVSFGWAPNATGAGTGVTRMARSQLYYRAA